MSNTPRNVGEKNPNWNGGSTKHPLYSIWHSMLDRCRNPRHARWADYGGRGITVFPEWESDFWAFVRDVGPRPEGKTPGGRPLYSLDRIVNDKGYEPGNVRWATSHEQRVNRRPIARKTHCIRGHELTEGRCATCHRDWVRERSQLQRAQIVELLTLIEPKPGAWPTLGDAIESLKEAQQ